MAAIEVSKKPTCWNVEFEKMEEVVAITSVDVLTKAGGDAQAASKDKVLNLIAHYQLHFDPSSHEAKRVLRKIDFRILPMLSIVFTLMLMDKNGLSYAHLMGIDTDCHFDENHYKWLGSIVYIGYLAGEIPVNFLMQRLPMAKFFSVMVMLWGIIQCLHAACHNFAGLAAARFFLGFLEVCAAPICIYILGAWYSKEEQVSRLAIWLTSYGLSNVFAGFLAWCFYQLPSFGWRGLFLLYGGMTFFMGIVLWFFLAETPTEAKWLLEDEKAIALERVRINRTGTNVWRFNPSQLKEAFCDIRFYMVFLIQVSAGFPVGGITVFGPAIISGLGFSKQQSILLNMGSGAAAIVGSIVFYFIAKYTNRTVSGVFSLVLSVVGISMMLVIPSTHSGALYGGYVLTLQFPIAILAVIAFMTAGIGGTTKKIAFAAAFQFGLAIGTILGPQIFRASDAPTYYPAKYIMLAFLAFYTILLAGIGIIHHHWNVKRDKEDALDAQDGVMYRKLENEEFVDLTDFRLRSFRYPT